MTVKIIRSLSLSLLIALILFWGKSLFIPMCYGLFIAIVMYPVCKWLETKNLSKGLAIGISLTIVLTLFIALLVLLFWQIVLFREDLPGLYLKVKPILFEFQNWLNNTFSITTPMQSEWLHNLFTTSYGRLSDLLQVTFRAAADTLFMLFLTPIFSALFLYHRATFLLFLHKLFKSDAREKINMVTGEVVHTYYNYIKGMIQVYIIVGVLNSVGLMVLGIKHAILFGMLTAIMTIIPYVGIIISASLPVSIAFISGNSVWYPIGVILVFSFVQYLEANIIFPKVVGVQLNVSTWATLVGIVIGGIIWGVSGMILFIPFVAILKIISSHVGELEPLHILLSRGRD